MATLKEIIHEVLESTGLPVAYRHSDVAEMPRFSYSLIYNGELVLSGETHTKKPIYQIDYFSRTPVDVENFTLFYDTRHILKSRNVRVGSWQEVQSYNEDTDLAIYHYYMECGK